MTELKQTGLRSVMTPEELADMMRIKLSAVKRMCEARAQSRPNHVPFFKMNGKIRFYRFRIMEWRERLDKAAQRRQEVQAATVPKGHQRKGRKRAA
jgi:hypothetical protein